MPGILGSELFSRDPVGRPRWVWSGNTGVLLDSLVEDPRRLWNPDIEVYCGDVIRKLTGLVTGDVYGPFLEQLAERGLVEGENLHLFPYDWRLDLRDSAERFAARMRQLEGDFRIVAHSMGGLVVRLALHRYPDIAHRTLRYVQAGTPCLGSAKAFRTLKSGDLGFGKAMNAVLALAAKVSPAIRANLLGSLQEMPSLYQLLPPMNEQCLKPPTGPYVSALDPKVWRLAGPKSNASDAASFHTVLEGFKFDRILTISDSGRDTDHVHGVDGYFDNPRPLDFKVAGDGTVPLRSSTYGTPDKLRYTLGAAVAHDQILNDGRYQREIFRALGLPT